MARGYRSDRRAEQAAETRRRVVDAARRLFAERGFAGTTINAIADAAGVAVPTVYASVGGKAAMLAALQERVDAESDVPAALEAIRRANDPDEVTRLAIDLTRRINEQFGDVVGVLHASASQPEAASALIEGLRRHKRGFRMVAQRLADLDGLREGVSVDEAAERLGALTLWGHWEAMVRDYGWSWDEAAAWLAVIARATLLRPPSAE